MTDSIFDRSRPTMAERFAEKLANTGLTDVPPRATEAAINDFLDMAGLCIAARQKDYVDQLLGGWDGEGNCTVFGHARSLDSGGAALINGTATHGEDFDDTLEGAPIRVGAMVIPAVLAACERFGRSGEDLLRGITVGLEAICRFEPCGPWQDPQTMLSSRRCHRSFRRRRRCRLGLGPRQGRDDHGIRHRRQHVFRYRRVLDRWCLDQAPAPRLGRPIRSARGPIRQAGVQRPAHGIRWPARILPRLRAHGDTELRLPDQWRRRGMADGADCLQALRMWHDDPIPISIARSALPQKGSMRKTSSTSNARPAKDWCTACGRPWPTSTSHRPATPPSSACHGAWRSASSKVTRD